MIDMLVKLLDLPDSQPSIDRLRQTGITIRRANPWELSAVREFITREWNVRWADEASVGFANKPVSVFIATKDGRVIGFAAHECTRRNFLGPMGVAKAEQTKGIGRALLLASLHAMREMGYVYAVIGGVGPATFYEKAAGAFTIPGSTPGIYQDLLKRD